MQKDLKWSGVEGKYWKLDSSTSTGYSSKCTFSYFPPAAAGTCQYAGTRAEEER